LSKENEVSDRKLLLDFYSSQLTTHSRLIIGMSVSMFTILSIVSGQRQNHPLTLAQWIVTIIGLGLTSWCFSYLIMRHVAYGILSSAAIFAEPEYVSGRKSLENLGIGIRNEALKHRIFVIFPSSLFISSGEKVTDSQKRLGCKGVLMFGALVCVLIACLVTYLLMQLVCVL
jgi:hypothetical protein